MRNVAILTALLLTTASPVLAADTKPAAAPFSAEQKKAIEGIIKDYLTKTNPEVVMQAIQELQGKERAAAETKSKEGIKAAADGLYKNPNHPVGGNPKGDVTIVEFFDYQCGYCKMAEESTHKLLGEDKNIKYIYVNYPILSPASKEAAKAALAANKQGKYPEFHSALMKLKDKLSTELIMETAKSVGLDTDKLKKDMADAEIEKIISANMELGNKVGVRGTPMFIINDTPYPGAMQYEQLKETVENARKAAKK